MKYQWILFDADNTLFDFDAAQEFALTKALEQIGITASTEIHETYEEINQSCWRAYEDGKLSKAELRVKRFALFLEAIGINGAAPQFGKTYLTYLSNTDFMIQGAFDILDGLMEQYQLGMVTNGLKEVQRTRIARTGMENYFKTIVISDEIGYSKPDAEFFDYTFAQIEHPPKEQVLIVGDNLNSDIKGGANYGIDTCWFNPKLERNEIDIIPTYEIKSLSQLLEVL